MHARARPQVIIGLLRSAMIKSGAKEFLIDGFPRAMDQAARFEEMIKPCEKVLFFDCPEEVMEARLLKRGETSGRADDNAETIRKRFKTFVEQSLPVIDHYEALGKAHKISATAGPDDVFVHVCGALDTMVRAVRLRPSSMPAPYSLHAAACGRMQPHAAPRAPCSRM